MANRPDLDDDDDFSEIYKAYTGPLGSSVANVQEKKVNNKRSQPSSDEEEERDPNAVPTDFTSREAKVWEAKSKATERNWKKRKEEEMICKICGDAGHFTQGCPSTLGGTRNSQDFFERVAARDKHVRALFTNKVIEGIERDIGCKIKMNEKFIIVSGKDRLILRKGVDAVHKVMNGECNDKNPSHMGRSRSPERSPIRTQFSRSESLRSKSRERSPIATQYSRPQSLRSKSHERNPFSNKLSRSESQRSNPSPRNSSQFHQRIGVQDSGLEEGIRGDLQKPSRNSPQAYGSDGGRGRSSLSRSPARAPYSGSSYSKYEEPYRSHAWENERRQSEHHVDKKVEHPSLSQTLEDIELEYKREAINLAKLRDQQEDEENYKHRETIRDLRENYMKRLAGLRDTHNKQWDEFVQLDAQIRQQHIHQQHMPASGFGGYHPSTVADYDSVHNQPYAGSKFHVEPSRRGQYPNPGDNYLHSRLPHRDAYNEFQHQRVDDYGRAFNRY